MSKQKSTTSIKQYFCSRPKQKVAAINQPGSANICSGSSTISFNSVVQEEQHLTVASIWSVSPNYQSTTSYN